MNPLRITTQPAPFTWRRKQDVAGDPKGPASPAAVTLTVIASGSGTLTYAWYEKPKNKNISTHGTKLASTASYAPDTTAWGMRTYYCVVSNGTDSVVSNYADVAVGCGAKTTDGNWLSFMCYNLGANTTLDPFVWNSVSDQTSNDIKGWLFQWGRLADGHQVRTSDAVAGPVSLPSASQVPAGTSSSGLFITNSFYATFRDWRSPQMTYLWCEFPNPNHPCPAGWVVPAQSDFEAILSDNAPRLRVHERATANRWHWTGNGYAVSPDGNTTTLFFPATGRRLYTAQLELPEMGFYWSAGTRSESALNFTFSREWTALVPEPRASGEAVRCVMHSY
jgi:uncharacterized protein (TIGR02145 family)